MRWHLRSPFTRGLRPRTRSGNEFSSLGSLLVLSNVWPQPFASAAGVRTVELLNRWARQGIFAAVHFATPSSRSVFLDDNNNNHNNNHQTNSPPPSPLDSRIVTHENIPINDAGFMNDFLESIVHGNDKKKNKISVVVYDRFHVEEMFSHHVHRCCPDALQVVDMQDMHSLRRGRQAIVERCDDYTDPMKAMREALDYNPLTSCADDDANASLVLRELASLHRSDLVLVCSPVELELLKPHFPAHKLCLASFWVPEEEEEAEETTTSLTASRTPSSSGSSTVRPFEERQDFCFVGGYRHDPNKDAVGILASHVWPLIRKRLGSASEARLHIYGAYPNHQIQELHNPHEQGLLVHGFVPDLEATLRKHRVMLAPLRYGAGLKGKIVDAWQHGLPVVTTPMGMEGMDPDHINNNNNKSGNEQGSVSPSLSLATTTTTATTLEGFVEAAVQLYSDELAWDKASQRGRHLVSSQYSTHHWDNVSKAVQRACQELKDRRRHDVNRSLVWHQSLRSTEYLSKWIESKSSMYNPPPTPTPSSLDKKQTPQETDSCQEKERERERERESD